MFNFNKKRKNIKVVDFFIIGAQKCGTSALHDILIQHPNIATPKAKEIHYFDNDSWYFKKNSIIEYNKYFNLSRAKSTLYFEASPLYIFHPQTPFRIFDYNPKAKFIVLLRNPTKRAFSAWSMYHHDEYIKKNLPNLHDPCDFDISINNELENNLLLDFYDNNISYIKRGIYHYQIKRWLKYFNYNQFIFIDSDSLKNNFNKTIIEIQNFLKIEHFPLTQIYSNVGKMINLENYYKTFEILDELRLISVRLFASCKRFC